MPYRIVYYIDSDNFGGAEQVLYTLIKGLDKNVWHPILAYHPYPGITSFIHLIEDLGVDTLSTPHIKGYKDINGILKFSSELRSIRPSIFHANINWPLSCSNGIIAAYLARIHTIIGTQHLYEEIRERRRRVFQLLVSFLVNSYIAVSSDLANQFRKVVSFNKIRVVQNGINLEHYSKESSNERDDVYAPFRKKDLPIVLTVARLAKQKGHTYLLKAVAKIPGALFIFAGDGPERMNLENEAHELNLSGRVIFLGERNDIPDLLSGCDLYVNPSIFEGGVAISIMEAMAACKPVITTEVEGVKKNFTNAADAIIVPPADVAALTEAITNLLSNPSLANRIAASGKLLAYREFSSDRMVKDVIEIYNHYVSRL